MLPSREAFACITSLPVDHQWEGVDRNTVEFFISTLCQRLTGIPLVSTGGRFCLFLSDLRTSKRLLLCSCAGGILHTLPRGSSDISIFLLCSFLKRNAWSVIANHIRRRILEGSLYQRKTIWLLKDAFHGQTDNSCQLYMLSEFQNNFTCSHLIFAEKLVSSVP